MAVTQPHQPNAIRLALLHLSAYPTPSLSAAAIDHLASVIAGQIHQGITVQQKCTYFARRFLDINNVGEHQLHAGAASSCASEVIALLDLCFVLDLSFNLGENGVRARVLTVLGLPETIMSDDVIVGRLPRYVKTEDMEREFAEERVKAVAEKTGSVGVSRGHPRD